MHARIPLVALLVAIAGGWYWMAAADPGQGMTQSAKDFLATLDDQQRAAATAPYDGAARLEWHFIPKPERKGLQVKHMNAAQRNAAHALLRSALSQAGYDKAETIMELEAILRELEKDRSDGPVRDPERYYFTLFGEPADDGLWGLSVEGHHLSLNFAVEQGRIASTTPTFLGANPAMVVNDLSVGPPQGTRVLRAEEELAFELLGSLSPEQRRKAIVADKAPADLRGAGEPHPPLADFQGLPVAEMTDEQSTLLRKLIEVYADNLPESVATERMRRIDDAGVAKVHFAWSGADRPGVGHYYVIEGPTFVIELVNTQPDASGNPANHIHSMWRNREGDFGLAR